MNIFVPQSLQSQIELEELVDVKKQIISPSSSRTSIGLIQDSLLSSYNLTSPTMRINWRNCMNIISYTSFEKFDTYKKDKQYTGHELFTMIIPPGINISKDDLKIKDSILSQGRLSKDVLGEKKTFAIHQLIWDEYGSDETKKFIDNAQRLLNNFNLYNGFTVGYGDACIDEPVKRDIDKLFLTTEHKVNNMIANIENNPNIMEKDVFEFKLLQQMAVLHEVKKLVMKSLKPENNFKIMVSSGSKGSEENIGQICGSLGFLAVEGKLVQKKYNKRTLAYFHQNDDRPRSRGLIRQPYIEGVDFPGFTYVLMAGREGCIDGAIKTAITGYAQRRLIKCMEDSMVKYDCSVRTANNSILQLVYGDSGADTTKQYAYNCKLVELGNKELEAMHKFTDVEMKEYKNYKDNDKVFSEIKEMRDNFRIFMKKAKCDFKAINTSVNLPVNLNRIINSNINNKSLMTGEKVQPDYVRDKLEAILENSVTNLMMMSDKDSKNKKSIKNLDERIFKTFLKTALYDALSPKMSCINKNLTKKHFDSIINEIIQIYNKSIVQPGDMIGILSAQAIVEPLTQMTLNSVDWDERIIISKNNNILTPKIGEFIDTIIKNTPDEKIQKYENSQLYVNLDDDNDWKALSTDENGKMMWTKLEAVTRHPVINEDGTDTILEVELESGRKVKATKGKSFLTLIDNKITEINGSALKIGDKLPLMLNFNMNSLNTIEYFDLTSLLPKNEWIYGDEIKKAKDIMNSNVYRWFYNNNGTTFRDAMNGHNSNTFREGCVYTKFTYPNVPHIPAKILLDTEFGFFVGAYLAEGNSNLTQINITNNDEKFLNKIRILLDKWNVGYHTVSCDKHCEKTNIKGRTTSLIIHSTLLAKVFRETFGNKSYVKTIPDWVYQSPDDFIKGLVDGYISGDGTISKRDGVITVSSVSEDLILKFGLLLTRYEIFSHMSSYVPKLNKFTSVSRTYILRIPIKYSQIFANHFTISIKYKQDNLDVLAKSFERGTKRETFNKVLFDKIKNIKEIKPMYNWVYDITVETTRNFTLLNTICVKDTFHSAGLSTMNSTTKGVPRVQEILGVSKSIKTPQLIIHLEDKYKKSKEMAHKIKSNLKYTTIGDVRGKINVYFDPYPEEEESIMKSDGITQVYYNQKASKNSCQSNITGLPWLMRIEIIKEKMIEKEVSLLDIKSKFCNWWETRYNDTKNLKKEEKKVINKITALAVMSNSDNDAQPVIHVRFNVKDGEKIKDPFNRETLNYFIDHIIDKFKLKGIDDIKDVPNIATERCVTIDENEAIKYEDEQVIYTIGANMTDIRYIVGIDLLNTISNDIYDVYKTFGIEIARSRLLREIDEAFQSSAAVVSYTHICILADIMTSAGTLMSIDRHGMGKSDADVLGRASFEKPIEHILSAAVFNESDTMKGVSARVMAGAVIKSGTGYCDVILDTDLIENSEYTAESKYKQYTEVIEDSIAKDIINKDNEDIFIPM